MKYIFTKLFLSDFSLWVTLKFAQLQTETMGFGKKDSSLNPISLTEEIILILFSGGKELYGLEITQAVSECSNGQKQITDGTLYPTLARLKKSGLIMESSLEKSSKGGGARQYYRITEKGGLILAQTQEFRRCLATWKLSF